MGWWSRKRVREYLPTVDRGALEASVKQQGWPLSAHERPLAQHLWKSCSATKKRAQNAEDTATFIMNSAALRFCEGVILFRIYGAQFRSFVGFKSDIPMYGLIWSGASTACFVDGPLLIILSTTIAPLCLRLILAWAWQFCLCNSCCGMRHGRQHSNKLK